MQTSMTFGNVAALFGAMAFLAAVPSVSVLAVSARAVSAGFLHGAVVAFGIVAADILFILLALFGLALLADALGDAFIWVKYAGAIYLIVLGASVLRAGAQWTGEAAAAENSRLSSFMSGFLITLGDQKAIFFYLGFLPAFVDLASVTVADTALVMAVTVVAVGGVKVVYAFVAARSGRLLGAQAGRLMNAAAGLVMIAVGAFLAFRAWSL
jgi:threonine/homoserine/homoserine lactone efflux protein